MIYDKKDAPKKGQSNKYGLKKKGVDKNVTRKLKITLWENVYFLNSLLQDEEFEMQHDRDPTTLEKLPQKIISR